MLDYCGEDRLIRPYAEILASKRMIFQSEGFGFNQDCPHLFPFQRDIVRWACNKGRCAIFADTGLGKTLMQLAWAANVPGRVLILAPLAVAQQTEHEAARFGFDGVKYLREPDTVTPITVTNYDRFEKFNPADYKAVVLDESSILKAYTGATKEALIAAFANTPFRLCCTATPSPNDHMELLNHSAFLGALESHKALSIWFINDTQNFGNYRLKKHAVSDFWRWVSTWAVSISKPSDLGYPDDGYILPAYEEITHIIDSEMEKETDGLLFRCPELSATSYHKEKRITVRNRAAKCAEIAQAKQDRGPILIWCETNYEADALAKQLPEAIDVRGSDSQDQKEKAALAFAAGEIPILISKPSIFGFGMNFQRCANAIYCGLSFSFESYYQSVRRIWRFGQSKTVEIDIVMGEGERHIIEVVREKEARHCELKAGMNSHIMKEHELAGGRAFHMDYDREIKQGALWEMRLGDSVELMREIEDDSVGLSIYSPPFSNLYIYSNSDRDMGNCSSDQEFLESYRYIIREMYRATIPGRLSAVHCKNLVDYKTSAGRSGLRDFRGDIIRAHEAEGWKYHSEVCIWKSPVTEMQRTKSHGLLYKQLRKDSSYSRQGMPDYLVIFRKWADEDPCPVTHTKENFDLEQWQSWASPVWFDIKQMNVLNTKMARTDEDEKHICPLQLDVIERAVTLWSNKGDLVFSPFAGIGSEGVMSVRLGRRFLGMELKREYFDHACNNLRDEERNDGFLFAEAGDGK